MTVKELLEHLDNGIIEPNGNKRNFDILDYYIFSKGMSPSEFIGNLEKNISLNDMRKVKQFFGYNNIGENLSEYYIKQIMATKDEVNLRRNEEGMPIPGTGRVITTEEKMGIIDYLLSNNIPLTTKLYALAMKRYMDDELEIELGKNKTK